MNIEEDTSLVHKSFDKDGSVTKARVFKKEIKERMIANGEFITKEWLARFTKENPEVYAKFRRDTMKKISQSEYENISKEEVEEIIDKLIESLRSIPTGAANATKYHRLISGILELLFYPYMAHPRVEQEIHEGRKRIDWLNDGNVV